MVWEVKGSEYFNKVGAVSRDLFVRRRKGKDRDGYYFIVLLLLG